MYRHCVRCDPLLPVIQQAVAASADGEARVKTLLGIEAIFGVELPQESRFVTAVTKRDSCGSSTPKIASIPSSVLTRASPSALAATACWITGNNGSHRTQCLYITLYFPDLLKIISCYFSEQ